MGSLLFAVQNSGVPTHNIRALLHQQFRIGVLCMMQDMLEIAAVHHCSVIQHHDTVCHARNGIQVMRNEDHGCVVIFFDMQKFIKKRQL